MGFRETRGTDEALRIEVFDPSGHQQAQSRSNGGRSWPLVWGHAPLVIDKHPSGSVRVAVGEAESIHRDLLLLSVSSALGLILGLALYLFPLRLFREEDLVQLFTRRSIKAAEEERLRLSRDLHDGIGQSLGAAAVALARVAAKTGRTPETDATARLIDAALNELRQVTQGLRPPSLDDLGIGPAVEALAREAERTGLTARIEIQELPRMAPALEETCFRLAQEALSNIVHHARATTFRVSLSRQAENVVLEVQDDGRGFSPASGLGLGLVGARERAAGVSGSLSVESSAGGGTRLRAVLPLRPSGDAA
jgi:two-component system NarL family sensor kinase